MKSKLATSMKSAFECVIFIFSYILTDIHTNSNLFTEYPFFILVYFYTLCYVCMDAFAFNNCFIMKKRTKGNSYLSFSFADCKAINLSPFLWWLLPFYNISFFLLLLASLYFDIFFPSVELNFVVAASLKTFTFPSDILVFSEHLLLFWFQNSSHSHIKILAHHHHFPKILYLKGMTFIDSQLSLDHT